MTRIVFKKHQTLYTELGWMGSRETNKVEFSHYIVNPTGKINCSVTYNGILVSLNSDNLRVYK